MFLKLLRWSLFFSLFLVPLNTLGQEVFSVCDRSDFMREHLLKIFQETTSNPNGTCEQAHLTLDLVLAVLVSGDKSPIENIQSDDFSGLTQMSHLVIEHTNITELPEGIFDELSQSHILIFHIMKL